MSGKTIVNNPTTVHYITYGKVAMMYRKAEERIENLIFIGWLIMIIGIGAVITFFNAEGYSYEFILTTGIYLVIAGLVEILFFSAIKWFVKATRCRYMLECYSLREQEVPTI